MFRKVLGSSVCSCMMAESPCLLRNIITNIWKHNQFNGDYSCARPGAVFGPDVKLMKASIICAC